MLKIYLENGTNASLFVWPGTPCILAMFKLSYFTLIKAMLSIANEFNIEEEKSSNISTSLNIHYHPSSPLQICNKRRGLRGIMGANSCDFDKEIFPDFTLLYIKPFFLLPCDYNTTFWDSMLQ